MFKNARPFQSKAGCPRHLDRITLVLGARLDDQRLHDRHPLLALRVLGLDGSVDRLLAEELSTPHEAGHRTTRRRPSPSRTGTRRLPIDTTSPAPAKEPSRDIFRRRRDARTRYARIRSADLSREASVACEVVRSWTSAKSKRAGVGTLSAILDIFYSRLLGPPRLRMQCIMRCQSASTVRAS